MIPILKKLKTHYFLLLAFAILGTSGVANANKVSRKKGEKTGLLNKKDNFLYNTVSKYAFKPYNSAVRENTNLFKTSLIIPCSSNGNLLDNASKYNVASVAVPFFKNKISLDRKYQDALVCIGGINVSVGNNCQFEFRTSHVVTGSSGPLTELRLQLWNGSILLEEGTGSLVVDGFTSNGARYEFINKTFTYRVIESATSISCSGNIKFEDKAAPILQCPQDTILTCAQVREGTTPLPQDSGVPTWIDCSVVTFSYSDQSYSTNCTTPYAALPNGVPAGHTLPNTGDIIRIIVRTFLATDQYGNSSSCEQFIYIRKAKLDNIVCPPDREYSCKDVPSPLTPSVTGYPMLDGDGNFNTTNDRYSLERATCQMFATFTEDSFRMCSGSYKILRTWTIIDWCAVDNPQTVADERRKTCTQLIMVIDKTPPSVTAQFTQYFTANNELALKDTTANFDGYFLQDGTNADGKKADVYPLSLPNVCGGKVRLTLRADDWSCTMKQVTFNSSDSRLKIISGYPLFNSQNQTTTAIFEGNYTEIGDYEVTITAKDECGYATASKTFVIHIRDNMKPFAVCIDQMTVSLGTTGTARVAASSFNNGSADNCAIDRFEVRRMANCNDPSDTNFKSFVEFYCCDVGKNVQVVFRVWDQLGNYNDCMVNVYVDDKLKPTCIAPSTKTITCTDLNLKDLSTFGDPALWDNCGVKDTVYTQIVNLDNCKVGTITRKWVVSDNVGRKDSCSQLITVTGKSDFIVDFPDDIVASCFAEVMTPAQLRDQMLKNDATKDGYLINNGCGVLAVEVKDDTLTAVPDACYKILRQIKVIDWCKYNPNNDLAGGTSYYGTPVCGDVHSNTNWQTQNTLSWQSLTRPTCTNARERRFRDADGLSGSFSDGIISFTQIIKVIDSDAPIFTSHPGGTTVLIKDADGTNCSGVAKVTVEAKDHCQGVKIGDEGLTYSWRIVDRTKIDSIILTGTGNKLNTAGQEGILLPYDREVTVYWTVSDRCGNVTACSHQLKVVDGKTPSLICKNINVELASVNNTGMATVTAANLCSTPTDNCTPSTDLLKTMSVVRESASSGAYPSVINTSVSFSCTDASKIIPVQIWVKDLAGNTNYCTAKITVQDNIGACIPKQQNAVIVGTVKTEKGDNLNNVAVILTNNGNTVSTATTPTTGTFTFNNLTVGQNYVVKPSKTDNILNGVSTFDILTISRHLLGVAPLTSPYKLLAADVDKDGEITTVDMLHLRRLILRQTLRLPNNNTSWRFIDKKYVFQNPQDPFYEDYPEVVTVNNAPLASQADFIALKVGDINNNASVSNFTEAVERSSVVWTLNAEDFDLEQGKEYAVALTSEQFEAIGYQFTLNVTEGVEIVGVESADLANMSDGNFAVFKNAITTSWNGDFKGKNTDIFKIKLKSNKNIRLSEAISIGSNLTTAEAYTRNGEMMYVDLRFKSKNYEGSDFKLLQNQPNPFDGDTRIGFNLPNASTAKLTIFDAAGRILTTKSGYFEKGYNEFSVNKVELPVSGVLFYRLDTPTNSATKKMIVMD